MTEVEIPRCGAAPGCTYVGLNATESVGGRLVQGYFVSKPGAKVNLATPWPCLLWPKLDRAEVGLAIFCVGTLGACLCFELGDEIDSATLRPCLDMEIMFGTIAK